MKKHYIGLMSGTSADGIDALLVECSGDVIRPLTSYYTPYSNALAATLRSMARGTADDLENLLETDRRLADAFSTAVNALLIKADLVANDITAIGSHGHTLRHLPNTTLQIADPSRIAAKTGITTVADFRRRDMANGGQGAPLAPLFHHHCFASTVPTAVVNIGGISNVTFLSDDPKKVLGFDVGPGNTLLDAWIAKHLSKRYDNAGIWARSGTVSAPLLRALLSDPYFEKAGPKSTGVEYFNLDWLTRIGADLGAGLDAMLPQDIQATLLQLTVVSIADAIRQSPHDGPVQRVIICGGGAYNTFMVEALAMSLSCCDVTVSDAQGVPADMVEAMCFAWLAKQTMEGVALDYTRITGASRPAILGGIYR